VRTDCNAGSLSRSWVETVALEAKPLLRREMLAFGGMVLGVCWQVIRYNL